jgi:polygalacturonase
MRLNKSILLLMALFCLTKGYSNEYNILKYNAVGDGKTNNTKAIQNALDDCSAQGGGTVIVPAGTFVTGMIVLKKNTDLHLKMGAELKADAAVPTFKSLVLIQNTENVSITGFGILNGNGKKFVIEESNPNRPYIVFVNNSRNVNISEVTLLNSPSWSLRLFNSEKIKIQRVTIYSHANYNNDGIDIDSKDVVISDCIVDSGDDALCLKSDNPKRFSENITVTNCIFSSNCNFIKMGTSSFGGFKNVTISNCVLKKASESPLHDWRKKSNNSILNSITGIAGIALEIVDGGTMDQINISNITMTGVQTPIFIRLGSRKNPTGTLKNVIISQILATAESKITSSITAVPRFYVENVILKDMIFNLPGGGTSKDAARIIPEMEKGYPENRMFGWSLPSYGFYIRHAKNIQLNNIRFNLKNEDQRPSVWLEDVHDSSINISEKDATNVKQINTSNVKINKL